MTKTMQPTLPKLKDINPLSSFFIYVARQQACDNLDHLIFTLSTSDKKGIKVLQIDTKYTMSSQGEWDCHHPSAHHEIFANQVEEDVDEPIVVSVCDGCNKWYDSRINEWRND